MEAQGKQDREAYILREAYRAGKILSLMHRNYGLSLVLIVPIGQAQKPSHSKQGVTRVEIESDGAYVEAGDGANRAQVFLPVRKEYVVVNHSRPLLKRKATWLIILLVLLIVGGVVAGIVVHEANKDSYSG